MDGLAAKVFGYLRSGVVGPELFLVDVFFKNITQNCGANCVFGAVRVGAKRPGIFSEKLE